MSSQAWCDRQKNGGGRDFLCQTPHYIHRISFNIKNFQKLKKSICSSRCQLHNGVIESYIYIQITHQSQQTRIAMFETELSNLCSNNLSNNGLPYLHCLSDKIDKYISEQFRSMSFKWYIIHQNQSNISSRTYHTNTAYDSLKHNRTYAVLHLWCSMTLVFEMKQRRFV